jgi:hypothetical protein
VSGLITGALEAGAIPYGVCPRDRVVYTTHSKTTGRLGHRVDDEETRGWCVSSWKYEVINGIVWGYEAQEVETK